MILMLMMMSWMYPHRMLVQTVRGPEVVGAGLIQTVTVSRVKVVLVEEGGDVGEGADVGEGVAVAECVGEEWEAYKVEEEVEEVEGELGLAGAELADRMMDLVTEREREILVDGWKKQANVYTKFPFAGPIPGPTLPSTDESASACFSRFFTDEVWELLVVETNRFAAQFRASQSASRPRPWHDVTEEEMKAFVGMLMVMGICKLPRVENYWSTSHPLFTPQLRKVMPLVRFQQIYWFCIH